MAKRVFRGVSVSSSTTSYSDDGGITWTAGETCASGTYTTVTAGPSSFVAGALSIANCVVSSDGATGWTVANTIVGGPAIAYGHSRFAKLGSLGNNASYSADDGLSWTSGTISTTNNGTFVHTLAFGNGRFVASKANSNIAIYSDDGITWSTTATMPSSSLWQWTAFGGNNFVSAATDGNVAYSANGVSWNTPTGVPAGRSWNNLAYGGGRFLLVDSTLGDIYSDDDGATWGNATILPGPANLLSYGNIFIATSGNVNYGYSANGLSWTTSVASQALGPVAFSNVATFPDNEWSMVYALNKFVGVKNDSATTVYSADGSTWTSNTLPANCGWSGIASDGANIVAISTSANAASTTDGVAWTARTLPEKAWSSLTCMGNVFAAVAIESNTAAVSSDGGVSWTEYALPQTADWTSVSNSGNIFVAITTSNVAASSTDGITWTQRTMPDNIHYNCVTWAVDQFTAVASAANGGATNLAATSADGISWGQITMPSSEKWVAVGPGIGNPVL